MTSDRLGCPYCPLTFVGEGADARYDQHQRDHYHHLLAALGGVPDTPER